MAFVKPKELVKKQFELVDLQSNKHFAIWNEVDKKVMKKGDAITFSNGTGGIISEKTQIPQADEGKYRYMISYLRNILVDGNELTGSFNKTTDDQINTFVKNFKELGLDLSTIAFVIEEQDVKMCPYKVSATKKNTGDVKVLVPNINTDLSEKESKIVEVYRNSMKNSNHKKDNPAVKSGYLQGFVDNGSTKERAESKYSK